MFQHIKMGCVHYSNKFGWMQSLLETFVKYIRICLKYQRLMLKTNEYNDAELMIRSLIWPLPSFQMIDVDVYFVISRYTNLLWFCSEMLLDIRWI